MSIEHASAVSDWPENIVGGTRALDEPIGFRTPGNYSINGRHSLLCSTLSLSSRGLELRVMVKPQINDRIDAIFDIVGRLQGQVRALTPAGVVMALEKEIHDGLREQFAFLADPSLNAAQRRHFRIKPRTPETTIRAADRMVYPAYVIDFSISGASIETGAPVGVGEMIDFARFTRAKIVRSFGDRRFGVEFQRQFRPQEFSWNIRL